MAAIAFNLKSLPCAMDPQVSFGLLVSGVAGGYFLKNSPPESPAVTCHCECASSGEAPAQVRSGIGLFELSIICLLSFVLGAVSLFAFPFRTEVKTKSKPNPQRLLLSGSPRGKERKVCLEWPQVLHHLTDGG